jgi:protein-export membrane protein, SecD/SecF family/protein-export membrane protein SecF
MKMKTINFMKHYKLWFVFSGAVILIGLIMMLVNGLNLGIDFTGGTMMQVELAKEVSVQEVADLISDFDLNPDIVHSGVDKTGVIIKTKQSLDNAKRIEVFNVFKDKYGIESKDFSADQFGPAMGEEIRNRAITAVLIASVFMLIYISIRFETVFGVAAIVCLLHDVFFLIAIYAITGKSISSSFIAAVLTIVGYSINDTIVVFDRVRENVKRDKSKDYFGIINTSVTQSMTRTINTSLTTLLVIGALYVFGASSIKEFAFPLLVGVTVGTYSSVFIASPVWAVTRRYLGKNSHYASK